jgi:methylphosphotriester-DNA--protein-cysteine methyltransferase
VNRNVNFFEVTNNKVHDNNIGIVLIGHKGVSPVAALDQARNGIVRNNIVHHNSSFINPSYNETYQNAQFLKGTRNTYIGKSMNRLQIQMCLDKSTGRIISVFLIY